MNFWPFKRKKNVKTNGDDTINSNVIAKKLSKFGLWGSCVGACLLGAAGIIGIGISTWKYTLGGEFGKSYNIRFELDNASTYGEDPTMSQDIFDQHNDLTSDELAQQAADSYSRYLQNQGIENITVYPEVIHDSSGVKTNDKIFINANIPNKTYYDTYTEKTQDVDKSNIFYGNAFSSRLTMIVSDRNSKNLPNDGRFANFSIIPLDKFIDKKRVIMDSGVSNQVDIHLTKNFDPDGSAPTNHLNIVHDILDTTTADGSTDDKNASQLLIVKNYNELLNYCSFVLQVFSNASAIDASQRESIIKYFKDTDPNGKGSSYEQSFATDYNTWLGSASAFPTLLKNETGGAYIYRGLDANESGLITIDTEHDVPIPDTSPVSASALPLFINSTFTAPTDTTSASWSDPNTDLTYKFMDKYVITSGIADKADSESPIANSFLKILPKKDPTDKKAKDEWQWLTLKSNTYSSAVALYNDIKSFDFNLPIKCTAWQAYTNATMTEASLPVANTNTVEFNQQLKNDVFGLKPTTSLILSLCLIIFMIGFIVSILYRIPGFIGALSIFGSFGLTLMILMLSKYTIAIPMLLALLIGVLATTICILLTCAKVKKHIANGASFSIALKKGLRGGLLSIIDIHAVLLLIAISIAYFAAAQLSSFGITLLLFSLISLAFVGILWLGSTFLLFYNKTTAFNTHWFTSKVKLITRSPILFDKEYNTTYSNRFEAKRFTVFGWKQILVVSLIVLAIILGITLLFTIGINGSYVFFGGTRIILPETLYDGHSSVFAGYSEIYHSNGLIYLYYANKFDTSKITGFAWTNAFNVGNDWISIQAISSAGIFSYIKHTIYAMLIASGFIAAYSFIRLNWTSVIAVFVGSLIAPILIISVIALCQIYIDLYVVLAVVVIYIVNTLLIINLVDTINNQWLRKRRYLRNELKKVINTEVKNSLITYGIFYGVILGVFIIFALFNSTSLFWLLFIVLIGVVVSSPILYGVVPFLLYVFILLRYQYASRIAEIQNPMTKNNYDRIDEQLIDNINKFKRRRIEV